MIARNVTTMIFLAASVMSVPARSEETRTASAPDPRVIQSLIDELNSDDFRVRETATRRLSEMGRPAIEPVVRAMDHGSLEVIVRATTILERIYRAGDDETIDEVESALERLGRHTNRSVSGRAEVVLVKCYPIRERRALEEIRLAGGVFIREVDKRETVVTETSGLSYNGLLLHLENWKAGDAGLRHVKRLTRLQALRIVPGVSGISAEAIRDLAAAMPALHIHERGAAKLGLVGQASQAPKGCEILRIEPGSAAEEADLAAGDVIVRFDDKPVPDFETLVELIKTKKPGDEVQLEIRRLGQAGSRTVAPVLKGWQP